MPVVGERIIAEEDYIRTELSVPDLDIRYEVPAATKMEFPHHGRPRRSRAVIMKFGSRKRHQILYQTSDKLPSKLSDGYQHDRPEADRQ